MIKIVCLALHFVDHILSTIQRKFQPLGGAASTGDGVDLDTLHQSFSIICCTNVRGTFIFVGAVGIINAPRNTVVIFAVLTLQVVRSVDSVTDFIRRTVVILCALRGETFIVATLVARAAVRVHITTTAMRLTVGSTDWFVCGAFTVIRASGYTDCVITPSAGIIRLVRLVTDLRGTVGIIVITTNINRLGEAFMSILVTKLIVTTVLVSATSAEVRSSPMTTDGIVRWAEAVIWTPWDTGF